MKQVSTRGVVILYKTGNEKSKNRHRSERRRQKKDDVHQVRRGSFASSTKKKEEEESRELSYVVFCMPVEREGTVEQQSFVYVKQLKSTNAEKRDGKKGSRRPRAEFGR